MDIPDDLIIGKATLRYLRNVNGTHLLEEVCRQFWEGWTVPCHPQQDTSHIVELGGNSVENLGSDVVSKELTQQLLMALTEAATTSDDIDDEVYKEEMDWTFLDDRKDNPMYQIPSRVIDRGGFCFSATNPGFMY